MLGVFADREADPEGARIAGRAADALASLQPAGSDERLASLRTAVREHMRAGAFQSAARAGSIAAIQLRNAGAFGEAATLLEECLEPLPPTGRYRPFLTHQLADVVAFSRDWARTQHLLDAAEASLDERQRGEAIAASIWSLRGHVLTNLGAPDQALPWIEDALALAEQLRRDGKSFRGALIDAHLKRAGVRMATESYDLLLEEVPRVLDDAELLAGRPAARARFLVRLAMAHLWFRHDEPSHAGEARGFFEAALATEGILELDRLTCQSRLAQLALLDGDLAGAARRLAEARSTLDAMAGREDFRFPPIEVAFLAALEARRTRQERSDDVEALRRRRDELVAAYEGLVAGWRERPDREGGVGFLRPARTQLVVSELVDLEVLLDPVDGVASAVERVLDAQGVGTLVDDLGGGDPTLGDVRRELTDTGGVLLYFPGPEHSHVFAIDAADLVHERIAAWRDLREPRDELSRRVRRSPRSLPDDAARARRRDEIESLAQALGRELLPVSVAAKVEGWSAVTVVSADLVGDLPFECLPLGQRELGRAKALAYLPSLPVGIALAERSTGRGEVDYLRDLCLVTQVVADPAVLERFPNLQDLPIDVGQVQRLTGPFGMGRVEELLRERATFAQLGRLQLARIRILHILTHGARDADSEVSAGLVLGADGEHDGLVWSGDLRSLALSPVVILSACATGAGPSRFGDAAATNLGGAVFRAGADTVVYSVARVALEPTLELMERLHLSLAQGATVAEALRAAREVVAGNGAWDDPYYHSLFHAYGLAHRAPLPPPPRPEPGTGHAMILLAVLAVAGLAGALVVSSRRA